MSRLRRTVLIGIGLMLVLSACAGQAASLSSASSGSVLQEADTVSTPMNSAVETGVPTEGTPVATPATLDVKGACEGFNDGFAEYREGVKEADTTNWLLLGAKLIDIASRAPQTVSAPLARLSDLAYARADADGGSVPKEKEIAVTDAVLKASNACTAAGVTLTL